MQLCSISLENANNGLSVYEEWPMFLLWDPSLPFIFRII